MMNFLKDENGQGMVEYGLIIALIAIVVIAVLSVLGGRIKDVFQRADDELNNAMQTAGADAGGTQ